MVGFDSHEPTGSTIFIELLGNLPPPGALILGSIGLAFSGLKLRKHKEYYKL